MYRNKAYFGYLAIEKETQILSFKKTLHLHIRLELITMICTTKNNFFNSMQKRNEKEYLV
jgi:hypothetical protein